VGSFQGVSSLNHFFLSVQVEMNDCQQRPNYQRKGFIFHLAITRIGPFFLSSRENAREVSEFETKLIMTTVGDTGKTAKVRWFVLVAEALIFRQNMA
jgi:hypothetical protein